MDDSKKFYKNKYEYMQSKFKKRENYNIFFLYKLSIGNNITNLNYNKISSNQNIPIIYYQKYIKKTLEK